MTDDSPYASPTTSAPEPDAPPPGTRPTGVTVIAILSLVFAGLGVFGILATAVSLFVDLDVGANDPMGDLLESNEFLRTYTIVGMGLQVLSTALLTFAGIKLLGMYDVGRKAANLYAVFAILMALVGVAVNIMVVIPALMEGADGGDAVQKGTTIGVVIGAFIGAVFSIGFPVAVLWVLNRASIRPLYR